MPALSPSAKDFPTIFIYVRFYHIIFDYAMSFRIRCLYGNKAPAVLRLPELCLYAACGFINISHIFSSQLFEIANGTGVLETAFVGQQIKVFFIQLNSKLRY